MLIDVFRASTPSADGKTSEKLVASQNDEGHDGHHQTAAEARLLDGLCRLSAVSSTCFNKSSAYVAPPSAEADKYAFVATERIRTADFRALSLGSDEGIGGLVRRKQQSVRTPTTPTIRA